MVDGGEVAPLDLLRAELQITTRRDELEQARANEKAAADVLRSLVSYAFAQPMVVNELLTAMPEDGEPARFTAAAVAQRPELAQLLAEQRAAEAEIAVAQAERAVHHQKHGLGGGGLLLEERREIQMADLNRTVSRIDPQIAGDSHRLAMFFVDDGEEQRIGLGSRLAQPDEEVFQRGKRSVGQIRPVSTVHVEAVRLIEFAGMTIRVESFQPTEDSFHRVTRRKRRWLPIGNQQPHRLLQWIRVVRHPQFSVLSSVMVGTQCLSSNAIGEPRKQPLAR